MKELRLGTIGSSVIVREILDNVQRVEGACLEAVYSRSPEKGRELAEQYGAQKVYTDLDAFLEDSNIDAVYISSPNLLHYEQTKKTLLAGKHVICEKPFCTRADQARELTALARERRLFLIEAVPTTFLPNYPPLRESLTKIGRVKLVLGNYTQYSARYEKLLAGEVPNVFNPAFAGGCLMDINYYNVYLTVALFGKPERADYHPNLFANGVDTSGVVLMDYPGFTASLAAAKDVRGVSSYQIEGEQGYICVRNGSNGLAELQVVTKDGEEIINRQPDPNRWYYEVRAIVGLIRSGDYDTAYSQLDITIHTVEAVEQARKRAGLLFPGDESETPASRLP